MIAYNPIRANLMSVWQSELDPYLGSGNSRNEAFNKHAFCRQVNYSAVPAVSAGFAASSQKIPKLGPVSRRGTRTHSAHMLFSFLIPRRFSFGLF
jgi:hypothetical protein